MNTPLATKKSALKGKNVYALVAMTSIVSLIGGISWLSGSSNDDNKEAVEGRWEESSRKALSLLQSRKPDAPVVIRSGFKRLEAEGSVYEWTAGISNPLPTSQQVTVKVCLLDQQNASVVEDVVVVDLAPYSTKNLIHKGASHASVLDKARHHRMEVLQASLVNPGALAKNTGNTGGVSDMP